MKIITHGGPAHADEFLAVAALLTKFPEATVERVATLEPETAPQDSIVVDIGRRYDGLRFFDHHQDIEMPCSFLLVLKDVFGMNTSDLPTDFHYVDLADRFGHAEARVRLGTEGVGRNLIDKLVLNAFSRLSVIRPDDPFHGLMRMVGDEVFRFLEDFNRAKRVKLLETAAGYVAFTETPLPTQTIKEAHPDKTIVGAVMPSRDGNTALITMNDRVFVPKATSYPKKFVHATGFVAVVGIPFRQVDPLRIVMECVMVRPRE